MDKSSSTTTDPPSDQLNLSDTDRISNLPEPVLCHILSFLSTKDAARSSVLSKQWQFLWTLLPILHLDQEEISFVDYESFESIAFKILLSRPPTSITKINLSCLFEYDPTESHHDWNSINLPALLSSAVERQVEEIKFDITNSRRDYLDNPFLLNLGIFSCRTLVVLKLSGDLYLSVGSNVQLPCVKVLHLLFVNYESDDSVQNLFTGCPVLEDLYVKRHALDDSSRYRVSSPTLWNLVFLDYAPNRYSGMTLVDAPALECLTIHYCGPPAVRVVLKNMHDLDRAKIYMDKLFGESIDWGSIMDTYKAVSSVTYLELMFGPGILVPEYQIIASTIEFPRFDNLRELVLNGLCCIWRLILQMLHCCPQLRRLTFVEYSYFMISYGDYSSRLQCEDAHCWMPPRLVPDCLVSHLTTFKFQGFVGSECEMELIRYVLLNSKVLENMAIQYDRSSKLEQLFGVLQKLSRFERGSPRCQLHFERGQRVDTFSKALRLN